jgi:sarcosine oxidase subunit alpha
MPHDLGVNAPRIKRTGEYIGRRSLFTAAAEAPDRRQLVGLETDDLLPTGAHTVELANGKLRSIGFVTSSYLSPTLQRPIAMALVERGRSRMGERIELRHLGRNFSALIAAPCALDPEGDRLNA